jgi:PAS domain S-box-containing protein
VTSRGRAAVRSEMSMKPTHTLVQGFVGALALLGGVAGFNWQHTNRMQETMKWVLHTHEVQEQLTELLSSVQDVETGVRGFVITGQPEYLEPFVAVRTKVTSQFSKVRTLTRDNARQQANCDTLEPLLARRVAIAQSNMDLRRNSGLEAAQREIASGEGKAVMDQIRAMIARMDMEEHTLLSQRSAATRREASTARWLTITGTGLSFALLIGVFALVLRENRLRLRSEAELDRFFTLSLDLLCISSADGYFKRISPAFTQTLGWSVEEILARPFLDLVHPDDRAATLRMVEQQVVAGEKVPQFENRYRHKDGSWRLLSWNSVPQPGGLMYSTGHDVTERKRAEESLRENAERFLTLANNISQLAWMADPQGSIFWYNQRWFDYTGTTLEEMVGWGWQKVHHPDHVQRVVDKIKHCFETGEVWEDTFPLRGMDGHYRWFLSRAVPIRDEHGTVLRWFGTNTDVTEREQAEEQIVQLNADLQQRAAQLEEANKELEAFSYSVSHDLRAPLRHVMGFVDLLQKDAGPSLSEKSLRQLTTISQSAKRMGDLIDDLLAFSQIGRAALQKTDVNLDELLREALADFQAETKERSIAWNIHPLPGVRADRALLRMALVNLISNAVKFTGARAETTIEIGCAPNGNSETVIFIRDNGAGFDPQYADKLFGVFQRLHSQAEFEGTGIGLANVQRIIHRHGGRAWAEGVVDGGATFYFSIPKQNGGINGD